jgi:hypothetical protein
MFALLGDTISVEEELSRFIAFQTFTRRDFPTPAEQPFA